MIKKVFSHSLYRNSFFLMLAMVVMAGFGFIFWFINAKLFSATDIGIATAIIPAASTISFASLFGLDVSLVRFFHTKEEKGLFVRSSLLFVFVLTLAGSVLFGLLSPFFSPIISTFFSVPSHYILFVLLTVTTSLTLICDSIYLAHKRTLYTLTVTTLYSLAKALFPLLFFKFGADGILLAAATAQSIGLIMNLLILQYTWGYFSKFTISLDSLHGVWGYTIHNYVSSIFSLLPSSIIPIIIINKIDTASSAYYYIAMMIANLLYVISSATTKSLFAEGSQSEFQVQQEVRKSIFLIFFLTIPAILILVTIAPYALQFFGNDYREHATFLLQIFAITAIPVSIYSVFIALFRIHKKTDLLLVCNILLAVAEIACTYFLIDYGLTGVAYAWLLANTVATLCASILLYQSKKLTVNNNAV